MQKRTGTLFIKYCTSVLEIGTLNLNIVLELNIVRYLCLPYNLYKFQVR